MMEQEVVTGVSAYDSQVKRSSCMDRLKTWHAVFATCCGHGRMSSIKGRQSSFMSAVRSARAGRSPWNLCHGRTGAVRCCKSHGIYYADLKRCAPPTCRESNMQAGRATARNIAIRTMEKAGWNSQSESPPSMNWLPL